MRIAVCIKQVPVLSAMAFDPETRTLKRDSVRNEISSFDVRALAKATELRAEHGGEVVALTMGPPQAREALFECLALGADRAIHLCDPAFAGADTLATAHALARALQREAFDLILCGRYSVDAETGQVGPEVAELLDIPQITAARTVVIDPARRTLKAERETDDGTELVETSLPALVTATEDLAPERFPSKLDREVAKSKSCVEVSAADLGGEDSLFGRAGSPTWVDGLQEIENTRLGRIITATSVHAAADQLAQILVDEYDLFNSFKVRQQPAIAQIASQQPADPDADIWVLAEELGGLLRPVSFELLGSARDIARAWGGKTSVLLVGSAVRRHADAIACQGADRVLIAESPALAAYDAEQHTAIIADAIRRERPRALLIPATGMGRDLAPRLAARLRIGLTGDCIDVGLDAQGRVVQYKPAFGGTIVAPILTRTSPVLATVRPGMLKAPTGVAMQPATIASLPIADLPTARVSVIKRSTNVAAADALNESDVIIGLGKGFGSAEGFAAADDLAQILGAAYCTTRDVADEGWLPRHLQVGLTGRAIAPKLYIAVAIRGAFEHMVGVRRAGLIVAINKNPKAPVFKSADYGIVGDFREALPALARQLAAAHPRQ